MKLLAFMVILAFLNGCATPAKMMNMTSSDIKVNKRHAYSIATVVTGGEKTTVFSTSKISDEDFQKALEKSILDNGVFLKIAKVNGADYLLEVAITDLWQPQSGFSMSVSFTTYWKISKKEAVGVIWERSITSEYTTFMGDTLVGVTRLRLATEGAARENIKKGIKYISELNFDE